MDIYILSKFDIDVICFIYVCTKNKLSVLRHAFDRYKAKLLQSGIVYTRSSENTSSQYSNQLRKSYDR